MNIFKKIKSSIYGPDFFNSLKSEKTDSSIIFYFKFTLMLSVISAVVMSFTAIPTFNGFLTKESVNEFVSLYPAELNLKISDGQFSTNVTEPYYIAFPKDDEPLKSGEKQVDNFVVIDTSVESFSPDILDKNKTMIFLTKNSVISEKDGGLSVMPLSDFKNFKYELNRESIYSVISKIVPVLKPLVYFIPFFGLAAYFIGYAWFLVVLFLIALVIWLILVIKKNNGGYMHAYRVTIHAMTLGLILDVIYSAIFNHTFSWLVLAGITAIVAIINIKPGVPASDVPTVETPEVEVIK
jgi:hypothetical protein